MHGARVAVTQATFFENPD